MLAGVVGFARQVLHICSLENKARGFRQLLLQLDRVARDSLRIETFCNAVDRVSNFRITVPRIRVEQSRSLGPLCTHRQTI